jgi:uncharacterized protein YihD (DUF1040 family)
MSDINHQLMALLDQYAQESGFKDLADLKDNYMPRAYQQVMPMFIRRAHAELAQEAQK